MENRRNMVMLGIILKEIWPLARFWSQTKHIVTSGGIKWQYKYIRVRIVPQNDCQVLQNHKLGLELPSGHGLRHLRLKIVELVAGDLFGTVVRRRHSPSRAEILFARHEEMWRQRRKRGERWEGEGERVERAITSRKTRWRRQPLSSSLSCVHTLDTGSSVCVAHRENV